MKTIFVRLYLFISFSVYLSAVWSKHKRMRVCKVQGWGGTFIKMPLKGTVSFAICNILFSIVILNTLLPPSSLPTLKKNKRVFVRGFYSKYNLICPYFVPLAWAGPVIQACLYWGHRIKQMNLPVSACWSVYPRIFMLSSWIK